MNDDTFTPTGPPPPAGPRSRQRRRSVLPVAAALLGLAFVAVACSSNPSNPGVAGAGSTNTSTTAASTANQGLPSLSAAQKAEELAHSRCMRSHGVSDYPDPDAQGRILIQGGPGSGSGIDPNSSTFKNAQKACQSLQPKPTASQQAQAEQAALRQSECMRAHGIKDYPDPSSDGRISISVQAGSNSDLNPNNPLFQAAQRVCMPNAPKPPAGGGSTSSGGGSGGNATTGGGQISSGP